MLTELFPAALPAVPLAEFARHLRLPDGFEDDGGEAGVLDTYLRAATAAIESMTGKALIIRDFRLTLSAWRDCTRQQIPVAPVTGVQSLTLRDADGAAAVVDAAAYRLVFEGGASVLTGANGGLLPSIPDRGQAELLFSAGYGADWNGVPNALRQAVMLLAAHYYEVRAVTRATDTLGVESLIAPYRERRL